MNTDTILQLVSGILTLVTLIVGRKATNYFSVGNRTARAQIVAILAKDVLSLVVLQGGVSQPKAELIRIAIDRLTGVLIGQGFKADTAKDIARSAIAGAAADQGFPLNEITI